MGRTGTEAERKVVTDAAVSLETMLSQVRAPGTTSHIPGSYLWASKEVRTMDNEPDREG